MSRVTPRAHCAYSDLTARSRRRHGPK